MSGPSHEPHVLVVTSASADPAAVIPVLAACEAAGMRVRAIDVGAAGAGGGGLSDRMRRALYGETAERRLRKEIDGNPPDVAIAFDPFAAQALSLARDQAANPAPVVAVVAELEPGAAWGQADADRYCAADVEAAVALADVGVEEDRVLVVGPIGERSWVDAGAEDRAGLRARFGAGERAVVVEVAGLGAELTGQLVMQLSLAEVSERITYLFDAGTDTDAAAMVRRQVPVLGLRAKLFGHSADAGRYWRAADVIVARPRSRAVARAMLVGARLLALVDDEVVGAARIAGALEARGRGIGARGILLVSSGLEALLRTPPPAPAPDGADHVVDVVWTVAAERRAVIEERRAAARADTHARIRDATAATAAAAKQTVAAGDLEDLGGDPAPVADLPDQAAVAALAREAAARKHQLVREVDGARRAAEEADRAADADPAGASGHRRRADAERASMYRLLEELAALDREIGDLDAATRAARAAGVKPGADRRSGGPVPGPAAAPDGSGGGPRPAAASRAAAAADPLANLKQQAAAANRTSSASVDDQLTALKRKLAETSKKK